MVEEAMPSGVEDPEDDRNGVGNMGLDPEQDEHQPPEEPETFDDLQGDVTGETVTPDFDAEVEDEPDTDQDDGDV